MSDLQPADDPPDWAKAPLFPLVEGMNMGVWIGFKHVNYLIEHGIARFLRRRGADLRSLYWGDGACLQLHGSRLRYEAALTHDEPVQVLVDPKPHGEGGLEFDVSVVCERLGSKVTIARGCYRAVFLNRDGEILKRRPARVETILAEAP